MGFDKYRNHTLQKGDEQEKLVNKYKQLLANYHNMVAQQKSLSAQAAAGVKPPVRSTIAGSMGRDRSKSTPKERPPQAPQETIQLAC
jgi:hypothetical protein